MVGAAGLHPVGRPHRAGRPTAQAGPTGQAGPTAQAGHTGQADPGQAGPERARADHRPGAVRVLLVGSSCW
jgi:hypothetical protein